MSRGPSAVLVAAGLVTCACGGRTGLDLQGPTCPDEDGDGVPDCEYCGDSPREVGFYDTPGGPSGGAFDVRVIEDLAYVADGEGGLRVVDVRDVTAPFEVGALDTAGSARAVEVAGSLAFIADGYRGLVVADVRDPARPVMVDSYETSGGDTIRNALDVAAIPGLALLAVESSNGGGLGAFEVDDDGVVALASWLTIGDGYTSVSVGEGLAYLGYGPTWTAPRGGLSIVDVTDPAAPETGGLLPLLGTPNDVFLSDGVAFVASGRSGLRVVDVSDPSAPRELGHCDTPEQAWGVAVSGEHAYVADGAGGLRVVGVAAPTAPAEIGSLALPGEAWGLDVVGEHVFVAAGYAGLRIISVACEDAGDPW
jgi:hypothetical protein